MSVPRQFHFLFGLKAQTAPFHLAHYLCLRSCLSINRPHAVHFHFRNEPYGPLWDLIRPELSLRHLPERLPLEDFRYPEESASRGYSYAHVSDFLRLAILQDEGGVYADMDTLFVNPMPAHLYEHPFVMGRERVDQSVKESALGGSLCNALFLAEQGSAFGKIWKDRMLSSFDGSWSRHSTFLPYEISQEFASTIHVEPESSFFYLDWSKDGLHRLFDRREILPSSVYSLHLWAHLWWDETRRDMSDFHQGRLTPGYVAYADTTFAHLARRHLPENIEVESRTQWRVREAAEHSRAVLAAGRRRLARKMRRMTGESE